MIPKSEGRKICEIFGDNCAIGRENLMEILYNVPLLYLKFSNHMVPTFIIRICNCAGKLIEN